MNRKRLAELVKEFLVEVGYDPDDAALKKTPSRVASLVAEMVENSQRDIRKEFQTYRTDTKNEVVILKDIPFFSFCEHHMLPFFGQVHIAYVPRDGIVGGFSHFVTLVNTLSRRLQLQERLGDEIADAVMDVLDPEGALVAIEARHLCVEMRGEEPAGTKALTVSARGRLKDPDEMKSVLSLFGNK
jgi:GTP cyclohydrolase I